LQSVFIGVSRAISAPGNKQHFSNRALKNIFNCHFKESQKKLFFHFNWENFKKQ
jgi:hypothetical protein